ncbi:methyltransferase domain-containing protein [Niveispirillum sp.]|uniref:SAM-dependent methyltransferase n=1 Tax=Niveispirillum sp. TaxID=1917217 RepID=UPI001B580B0C|nr:methyltransferase domain-containing protein [Niveispirillum sp.]MBP7337637.1 methyltransferase domain-containing protein [Niveispirillum sp.]
MAATRSTDDLSAAPPTLKERFLAWWEGIDVQRRNRDAEEDAAVHGGDAAAPGTPGANKHLNRKGKPLWTATRIEVVEKIWGPGFSSPGGDEFIPTIVKPLGLNPAMSVLDIGAGLGGATRAMAKQYGTWVTGVEGNPVLAEAGMFRSQKSGLARQSPILSADLENFTWNKRVDAIFSKEIFYTIRNKDKLIDSIEAALKPRGQLLFTDYVIDPGHARGRDFDGWMHAEPVEPTPWTVEQYAAALAQRNLDTRITEDNTDTHRSLILNAIQELVKHLETVSMDHDTKLAVVEEVEMWARRVAALSSGLRYYRFYALKPAELT